MNAGVALLCASLLHRADSFELPYAGGCNLGTRTVEPHMFALRPFGLEVKATDGEYHAQVNRAIEPQAPIVLTERGDTVTENALMAAALHPGVTVDGVGTTTLTVTGLDDIDVDVDYAPSEDPIEAMSLLAAAIVTKSEITIRRVPIEFLEIELATLGEMGFVYVRSEEYVARNGNTRLVDITTKPSDLHAPLDKIHPMPFPGLNIDNLPFFAVIAAVAEGQTLLHDWVYENRAIYLTELNKLGAQVKLLDPHRVLVDGPTHFSGAEIVCPPALRPAVVILLAMLASKGRSVLRSTYVIHRGYEDLAERLNELGANIETFRDI